MIKAGAPWPVPSKQTPGSSSAGQDDQTSVTAALNSMIQSAPGASGDCVYCGGHGVVIRNPFDTYEDDTTKSVVPATFWVNDIMVPSQIYPDCDLTDDLGDASYRAAVGYVIGGALGALLPDIDNIQRDDWGWGVFYATDSNSVDWRCRWIDTVGYDCPGYSIPANDLTKVKADKSHVGSGAYSFGNPFAGLGGGGTGFHFDLGGKNVLDQETGCDRNGICLTWDADGQCEPTLSGNDWVDWVEHWIKYRLSDHNGFPDPAACWVNNLRDMIQLQNAHYFFGSGVGKPVTQYWGWNELPLDRETLRNPLNWDAIMIHLPADICNIEGHTGMMDSVDCLHPNSHWRLERTLTKWVDAGYLVPGLENVAYRPGSYVVFAREFQQDGAWFRWFYCEYWSSPSNLYEIVSYPQGENDGACVIQWHSAVLNGTVARPNTSSSGLPDTGMVTMI